MNRQRHPRWRAALAGFLVLTLAASACADDDDDDAATDSDSGSGGDLDGTTVTIFGSEVETELQGNQDAFDQFTEDTGITVEVSGDRSFETQIGTQIDGGDPPDIALFPQPGQGHRLRRRHHRPARRRRQRGRGELRPRLHRPGRRSRASSRASRSRPTSRASSGTARRSSRRTATRSPRPSTTGWRWPTRWRPTATRRSASASAATTPPAGRSPTGSRTSCCASRAPTCTTSGTSTRSRSTTPTSSRWARPSTTCGRRRATCTAGSQNVAATPFADAGLPLLEGNCMMHRQGNFYSANFPDGTTLGPDGDVDAFYLPGLGGVPEHHAVRRQLRRHARRPARGGRGDEVPRQPRVRQRPGAGSRLPVAEQERRHEPVPRRARRRASARSSPPATRCASTPPT